MNQSRLSGLYVITDPKLIPSGIDTLVSYVREALEGGARIVQYRNKLASAKEQVLEAAELRKLTHEYGALLLINDSVSLCLDVDADGVHIGQSDGKLSEAKSQLGDKLLGITCHDSLALAEQAIKHGADYCAFGAVYPSSTKPSAAPCSLARLREASKLPVPICAIGGIEANNASSVLDQGIDMLAVISGVFGQSSIRASAKSLASLF